MQPTVWLCAKLVLQDGLTNSCTLVLILYEYLITLDAEGKFFWRKEISCTSMLFFLNRYLSLLYRLSIVGFTLPFTDQVSTAYILYSIETHWVHRGMFPALDDSSALLTCYKSGRR